MHDDPTLPLTETQRGPAELALARDRWGEFKLLARVGHGAFGEVYRAWDPSLEREVALKLLLPVAGGQSQSKEEYKSMLREARALAAIQHPNIVHVYGIDRHDGRVGFWTDFVKGKTLSSLLGSQGSFGYREAALIGLDLSRALSAVHRAGMLHRDIKAENVMREEGGRILLMDFGLSALPQLEGKIAGTPSYMAPELWAGSPATAQTDIYAMGVLLYFMVTGEHPVKLGGLSSEEAIAALSKRRPLIDLRPDLPEPFLRAVNTAMETEPAKRFGSAGQLAGALAECLGTAAPPVEAPIVRPAWHKSAGVRVAAVALVLAMVGWRSQTVRGWLHIGPEAAASGVSSGTYDAYLKAQELLQHSYKSANVTEAITRFQAVLAKDPKFALAEAGLGAAYFVQYRNSSDPKLLGLAKEATDRALALDATLAPAYVTEARMQAMAGQTDLAMQQAQKAISLDPRSADAYGALAEVYEAQGKLDDAVAAAQNAIDLAPENSMWLVRQGNYYLSQGKSKEAAAVWSEAAQKDPQNTFALYNLGVVEMRLSRLDEAQANLEKVLAIGPDADSYGTLGTIAEIQGRYSDSIKMYKQAIELTPNDYKGWGNLGSAYLLAGETESAGRSYEAAIRLAEKQRFSTPDDPELLIDLADYYASLHDAVHSIQLIRKALALSPNDPKIIYFAGESYELLGRRTQAIGLVSKALALGYQADLFQRSPEMALLRADPAFQSNMASETQKIKSGKK